jgi:NADPH-dependent glutamate synthase beta subunit-like oxidoreductase
MNSTRQKCLHISKEFEGRYVAMKDENDTTVVGSGPTPMDALKEAEAKGHPDPIFFFVPESDIALIY